jgi:hypothetical protein
VGILTSIKKYAVDCLIVFNRLYALLSRRTKLHGARFAGLHELATLMTESLNKEASLILGISHLGNVLRVRPVKTRRELGNLLVVAPTRGGKGLLATSQLRFLPGPTRLSSTTSRESFLPRPQATGQAWGRFL